MKIELTTSPSAEDAKTIGRGLMNFNQTVIGHLATDPGINFSVFARTDSGTVIGGLRATCFWNMLHVEVIWLGEEARGQGIGTALMHAAEEYAIEQGYELALLESSSWQAKPFYEKLGYKLLATVPEYPKGHSTHFLTKRLTATNGAIRPQDADVVLRSATPAEKDDLYALVTMHKAWTKFNGPYFPYATPSIEEFAQGLFRRLCEGKHAQLIEYQGKPVGSVTYYWENENTRWLEVGVVLYDQTFWNRGIGRNALALWITYLFETLEIERVGATTWSGNPGMIACAKSIGFQLEAKLRKVRYHQGVYYDSIKLGVLRAEWFGA